jgi:LacI family transcriptional regulator
MSLKVTLADIALELNTTAATVSRALSGDSSISEKTRLRIVETASRLKYKPHRIAASLRKGQSGLIGVIIPSAEINFFGSVVHGIENLANENGYSVLIYQSNELPASEVKGIETFLSARVDGILVSIAKQTADFSHFLMAKDSGIPIVFFDRSKDALGIHSVVIDDYKGGYIATKHLIDQGYKKVAHISGPQHLKIFKDRLRGYKKALKDAKLPMDETLIYNGDVSIESGRLAIAHFLQMKNPPDAVFAVEDFTALGAIKALKENNTRIPEDFGVIGFANESFGEHITPTLSTIDQQTVAMGKNSFELLMKLMNNGINGTDEKKIVLEPIPVLRESSRRIK